MENSTISIKENNTTINFKAWRIEMPSGEEGLCLYGIKNEEEILILEESLSNLPKKIKKVLDFGITTSPIIEYSLLEEIYKKYLDFPVLPKLEDIGYQYDRMGNIIGYLCGQFIRKDGSLGKVSPSKYIPKIKGETGQTVINEYMYKNVVRQTVLLHQLAAPINGLFNQCSLMALVGPSSYGKTTLARLAQSFFGDSMCQKNNYIFNGTVSGAEEHLAGINGYAVLFDDDSLIATDKYFSWQEAVYRLGGGVVRFRHDSKKFTKTKETVSESFCVNMNILAARNHHSGILETGVPDTETSIDWLDYPASEMEFLSSPKPLAVR